MRSTAKRVVVEGLGWILVVVGIAALVLPGPGLLALFAGVALLARGDELIVVRPAKELPWAPRPGTHQEAASDEED